MRRPEGVGWPEAVGWPEGVGWPESIAGAEGTAGAEGRPEGTTGTDGRTVGMAGGITGVWRPEPDGRGGKTLDDGRMLGRAGCSAWGKAATRLLAVREIRYRATQHQSTDLVNPTKVKMGGILNSEKIEEILRKYEG
jgi:hypothetical protein